MSHILLCLSCHFIDLSLHIFKKIYVTVVNSLVMPFPDTYEKNEYFLGRYDATAVSVLS